MDMSTFQDVMYEFNTVLLSLQRQECHFQETLKSNDPFLTNEFIHKMDRLIEKSKEICNQFDMKTNEKTSEINKKSSILFQSHPLLITLSDLVDYPTEYDELDEKKIILFELIGIYRELLLRRQRVGEAQENFENYKQYEIYELYNYFIFWKILFTEFIFYFRLSEKYIKLTNMFLTL